MGFHTFEIKIVYERIRHIHFKMNVKSDSSIFPHLSGQFYNYYQRYDYTYISCGIILIVASLILFLGMGLNYRLLAKEKKNEERKEREEPKEERAAMLAPPSPSKSDGKNAEPAAVVLDEVARMDEDTV